MQTIGDTHQLGGLQDEWSLADIELSFLVSLVGSWIGNEVTHDLWPLCLGVV